MKREVRFIGPPVLLLFRRSRSNLWAAVGGTVAISFVLTVSTFFLQGEGAHLLVASMGASAVLLFSAPEAALSQPWNVGVGQVLSALVGVTVARLVDPVGPAAALAVGLSILAMRLSRSTHPPGGATALSAVVGGPAVHQLGYAYVVTPVLLNTVAILVIALVFHLPRGRYPASDLARAGAADASTSRAAPVMRRR